MVKTIVFGVIISLHHHYGEDYCFCHCYYYSFFCHTKFSNFWTKLYHNIHHGTWTWLTQFGWPWPIFQGHRSFQSRNFGIFEMEYILEYWTSGLLLSYMTWKTKVLFIWPNFWKVGQGQGHQVTGGKVLNVLTRQ
jgi:hypothetical protein